MNGKKKGADGRHMPNAVEDGSNASAPCAAQPTGGAKDVGDSQRAEPAAVESGVSAAGPSVAELSPAELSPAGELSPAELSPAETAESRRYHQISLRLMQLDFVLDLAFWTVFGLWVVGPLEAALRDWGGLMHVATARLSAVFLLMTALHAVVSLPLTFYRDYVIEHRFGLSTLAAGGWAVRYAKRLTLGAALSLAMIVGVYWLFWLFGPWWWLVAGPAFFLLSAAMAQWLPVLILPLFYPIRPLERETLRPRAERLAVAAGLKVEGIYRIELSAETVKANAMLAGLGRTRRILLGDTLLANFTDDEIEVVLAHEVGHHVHRHISWLLVAALAVSMAGLWLADAAIRSAAAQPALFRYGDLGPAALPWLMIFFALWGYVSGPVLGAVSRHFERQADRYALRHASRPTAFFSAFRKLARLNKEYPNPDRWEVILYYSHPPIAERLESARAIVGEEPCRTDAAVR